MPASSGDQMMEVIQMDEVRVVRPSERTAGPPTPGMDRQQAFETGTLWAGWVRAEAGTASAWHHHGEHETAFCVLSGAMLLEFGPGGDRAVEAGPGDFVYVPKRLVHRESVPSAEAAEVVVFRTGTGGSTFNVDGPEPT